MRCFVCFLSQCGSLRGDENLKSFRQAKFLVTARCATFFVHRLPGYSVTHGILYYGCMLYFGCILYSGYVLCSGCILYSGCVLCSGCVLYFGCIIFWLCIMFWMCFMFWLYNI